MRSFLSKRFLTLVAATPALAVAQGTTTAAITGTVWDAQGRPVAGAVVRLGSPALIGGERRVVTQSNGTYRMPLLPPGQYRILVEAEGFQPLSRQETLELGRTTTVNWTLAPTPAQTVEVVAIASDIHEVTPTNLGLNLPTTQVETLPVARELGAVMNLTPGINGQAAWGGTNRNNAFLIDGVNVGDPATSSQWIFPNMDWIEEIQIGGLGAPAEVGNFTGSYANAIIKRGGNTTTGGFSGYYATNAWQEAYAGSHPLLTEDAKKPTPGKSYDLGFHLGGPIQKDRLWYFASLSKLQDEETIYGTDQTGKTETLKAIAKLTWQVSTDGTLEAFYSLDSLDYEHRGMSDAVEPLATWKQRSPNHTYNLAYTHVLGSGKVLMAKLTGYTGELNLTSYNGEAPSLYVPEGFRGISLFNNVQTIQLNDRSRLSFASTFDWYVTSGSHSHALRMGVDVERSKVEETRRIPGNLRYEGYRDGIYVRPYTAITGGGRRIDADLHRWAAFLQDTWNLGPRLILTPGLRWERYEGLGQGNTLWSTTTLAPRLGFTWSLTSNLSQVIKAHWGRYYEALSSGMFSVAIPGALPTEIGYAWGTPADAVNPFAPSTWSSIPVDYGTERYRIERHYALDPDVKHPYADAFTASYEFTFAKHWRAGLTVLSKRFHDAIVLHETAVDAGTFSTLRNPLTGQPLPYWITTLRGNDHRYLITNDERGERRYDAGTLSVARNAEDAWDLAFSYTRARLRGNLESINELETVFLNPNNLLNAYGDLPGVHDHEVKLRAGYRFATGTTVQAVYTYLSGTHWTPVLRITQLGPDQATTAILNAAPLGSETHEALNQLDLRIAQNFRWGSRFQVEGFLEGRNLLNDASPTEVNNLLTSRRAADITPSTPLTIQAGYLFPNRYLTPRNVRVGLRLKF